MILAAAYWGPGKGPVGDEAIAALSATWDLAERLTSSRTWYRTGERPNRPVTREDLPTLLAEGVNLDDGTPRQPIVALGRTVSLWDGTDVGAQLSATVEGTASTWRGHALLKHPDLPTRADDAWPILAEFIRIWHPDTASWTNRAVRKAGIRVGLTANQPHLGVLTWVKDGIPDPFTNATPTLTDGGALYCFADNLDDITPDLAATIVTS